MLLREIILAIKVFKKYNTLVLINLAGMSIALSGALILANWISQNDLNLSLNVLTFMFIVTATINYTFSNTSTVSQRSAEIGIRKYLGSSNWAIKRQFIIESSIISLLSILMSLVLSDLIFTSYGIQGGIGGIVMGPGGILIILFLTFSLLGGGMLPLRNVINLEVIEVFRNRLLAVFRKEAIRKVNVMFQIGITFTSYVLAINYLFDDGNLSEPLFQVFFIASITFSMILVTGLISYGYFLKFSRNQEIIIRKASGALTSDINHHLFMEMGQISLAALLITIPIIEFLIENWLSRITYIYGAQLLSYLVALSFVILLLVVVFSYFINKIAQKNPIGNRR